jgi:hypothetical protein
MLLWGYNPLLVTHDSRISLCSGGPRTEARWGASNLNAAFAWVPVARTEWRLCILARTARVMLPVSRKLRLLDSMEGRGSALCKITGHMLREQHDPIHRTLPCTQTRSCEFRCLEICFLTVAGLVIEPAAPLHADDKRTRRSNSIV